MTAESDDTIEVWLATEASDRRAMHEVIAVFTASYTHVIECEGSSESGPVEAVLAAAGFRPGRGPQLSVREVPCDVRIVLHRGFSVPASTWPKIEEALRRSLTGSLGGYFPVLAEQAFFHRSAVAFDYAWSAAGRPPVRVRHPDLVAGVATEDGTPGRIDRAAEVDLRVASARLRPEEEESETEEPDPWTRGPIEGEDPSPDELWIAENPT